MRERIQEVNFLGVSGRVHFKNGDRLASILIKQQFVSRYEVIGQFVHAKDSNGSLPGHLEWDPSRIKWATGQIPSDLLPGKLNVFIFVTRGLGGLWSILASVAGTSTSFLGGRGEGWGGWGVDEGRNFEDALERKKREKSSITTIKKTKRRLLCAQARSICLFVFFSNLLHFSKHQTDTNPFFGSQGDILDLIWIFFILLEQNLAVKRYAA